MKIPATPFTITKFAELPPSIAAGSTGSSLSRTATMSDLRVRVVEFGPDYLADHWCDRGHVFYLLRGEVVVELRDGRSFPMKAGECFQVSDDGDSAHRVRTAVGGTAFIVD
jgi:mannose-6-phosphate isomerase-like protein (cupin superfamily)